ncbi:hypothetical protein BKA57DRAFT_510862 [Linnemannia elongata]|nr:hypothetical protein BKA57DRAFT_510862 [Linnemannia elongata]
MASPFNPLDYSLGDLHSSSSPYPSSSSTAAASRPKTFTRVARGVPANNSSSSLFPTPSPKSSPYSSSSTTATTTSSSPSYFSLANSSLSPSECTANNNKSTPIYSSGNNATTPTMGEQKHSQQQQQKQLHGLNRFRPNLYTSPSSCKTDFLEDIPSIVDIQSSTSSSFTALRHVDRKDLLQLHLDPSLVLLSQDELAEKHVASAPSSSSSLSRYSPFNNTKDTTDSPVDDNNKAVSKPCPTFTRITKPRTTTPAPVTGARTGFYRLGDLGNTDTNTNKGNAAGIDLLGGGSYSSLLHQEDNKKGTMPSLSLSTSSPSSSCVPSPWSPPPPQPPPLTTTTTSSSSSLSPSSTLSSSNNNNKPSQSQSLKAPSLLLPPLSLSLSPPPSSVPSLSSSASSACSSASSSSSPPTSHFLFPTVDHLDWWQGLGSSSAASFPAGLEQRGEGGGRTGSRTAPSGTGSGSGSGSSLTTVEESFSQDDVLAPATIATTPSSHTFYRQQPQSRDKLNKSDDLSLGKDPVVDHLALTPAGSAALDLNNDDNQNKNYNSSYGSSGGMNGSTPAGTVKTTPSTRKTYSLARARVPPPPCVITGFCSISKTPIKPSGEPSPQDFLGEADLPYPLPSTLHDRQTRQRKRAEQLRQLKIREECEAQEKTDYINNNRRRAIRRRVNSYSAGMMYSPASSSASTSLTPHHSLSPPSSSSNSSSLTPNSPAVFSDSPRMHSQSQQSSTTCFRSPAWHQQRLSLNQHLKRSPSSPTRGSISANNLHLLNRHSTCNIGQSSKDKLAMLSELSTPLSRPRRKVAFDLENIQVFEYDISGGDDWSPLSDSGPSSPTVPPASTNGRDSYVRYCPPSDCSSSSSGSSDEESSPRPPRVPTPTRDLKSKVCS